MKTELVIVAIATVISFVAHLWLIGIILGIILIYLSAKTPSKQAKIEAPPQYSEFEFYKTAAEIEHQLHKDAMEDKP